MVRWVANWSDSLERHLKTPRRYYLIVVRLSGNNQEETEVLNLPCCTVLDIDSSETEAIFSVSPQGGISPRQLAAASARCVTTSATLGREYLSPSQQRWTKVHSESEKPMARAFAGLSGRSPWTRENPNSVIRIPPKGRSPVRTWALCKPSAETRRAPHTPGR